MGYMLWLVLHEFPQYDLKSVGNLTLTEIGFLLGGVQRYHTGKSGEGR
jgi:hypothetical protein